MIRHVHTGTPNWFNSSETFRRFLIFPFDELQSPEHIALNRRAASEGMCLYKNANNSLPLKMSSFSLQPQSLLVAGATADDGDNLQGNYAPHTDIGAVSILDGLIAAVGATSVVHQPGCLTVECPDTTGFAAAVAAAQTALAAVVVLGTKHDCSDSVACEGEGHDRTSIDFAGHQLDLVHALAATPAVVVCVLVHGGSMALASLLDDCDAIVDTWFPGGEGGNALSGILQRLFSSPVGCG